jgi:signal transduction histidine kinase
VADLELEVDRLRRRHHFLNWEVGETLRGIQTLCAHPSGLGGEASPLPRIAEAANRLTEVLRDLQESPGYHPANDQVIAIAVRPLAAQVFRQQQRLMGVPQVVLRFKLESESVEWFPARLRHILDNLISNALNNCDPGKNEPWVQLELRLTPENYELRVLDNGVGLATGDHDRAFDLFDRATPGRAAGLGVGLPVAKRLIEQSGGALTVDSGEGQGTTFVALLPRYDVDDFLL